MTTGLFLFGAGASYGSDTAGVPPLGAELFNDLQKFDPNGWGRISDDLAERFHNDFEDAMIMINPNSLGPLQRIMAAYFFDFQPSSANLYMTLARRIYVAKWPGAACSLNYERLLEQSLLANGLQPVADQATEPGVTLELCLPHGCCHIFCDVVKGRADAVIFNGYAVSTNGQIKAINNPKVHQQRLESDAFPPVMSYFEPKKRTTSGHSFINAQRLRWRKLALASNCIAVVGVKVRPHDVHIWEPLETTKAKIVYCGGPMGASDYLTWATKVGRSRKDLIIEGYFADNFDRIVDEVGL